jgi:CheY-like chemotaxis protein
VSFFTSHAMNDGRSRPRSRGPDEAAVHRPSRKTFAGTQGVQAGAARPKWRRDALHGMTRAPLDDMNGTRLAIVVVDDDPGTGDGLARLVRLFGHDCRVASSGEEAIRLMSEGRADAVISDWEMPGMNGAELCRRTRSAADEAPYTYFILVSGFDDREHLFEAMDAGADHYQRKPVDLDALEAQLLSAGRVVGLLRRLAARTPKA